MWYCYSFLYQKVERGWWNQALAKLLGALGSSEIGYCDFIMELEADMYDGELWWQKMSEVQWSVHSGYLSNV